MSDTTPFKLEIRTESNSISFGRRSLGQSGRDILAVKLALGLIQDLQGILSVNPEAYERSNQGIPMDPEGWFDCTSGTGIDIGQASKFDDKLKKALTNYQVKNQFLITRYLFEKFSIPDLIGGTSQRYNSVTVQEEYDLSIGRQMTAAVQLFESELGMLGEATIAVLHGWLPQSVPSNSGYVHSDLNYGGLNYITDVVPEVLYNLLIAGRLGQTKEALISSGALPDSFFSMNDGKLKRYLRYVPETINWVRGDNQTSIFPYGSIDYQNLSENNSALYRASLSVMLNYEERLSEQNIFNDNNRGQLMRKVLYPDPFSTTDPFYINELTTGFYYETDFVLSPEGPLPDDSDSAIEELEEKALAKILEIMQKPSIWYIPIENPQLMSSYGRLEEIQPSHVGYFPVEQENNREELRRYSPGVRSREREIERVKADIKRFQKKADDVTDSLVPDSPGYTGFDDKVEELKERLTSLEIGLAVYQIPMQEKINQFFVLGTMAAMEQQNSSPDEDTLVRVSSWRSLERDSLSEPLIKFVEFKTPSLRPGQKYRALFEINNSKLEFINNTMGYTIETSESQQQISTTQQEEVPEGCADQNTEESNRTMEEFRAHARAQRRNMVRKIREKLQKEEQYHNMGTVDAGILGPFDLNAGLSAALNKLDGPGAGTLSGLDDYEYTRTVLSTLGEAGTQILQAFNAADTDIEFFNNITAKKGQEFKTAAGSTTKDENVFFTLEEFKERVEIAQKDILKSGQILEAEGASYAPGSNFVPSKEASMLTQFSTQLIDLLKRAVIDVYDEKVWNHMLEHPDRATIKMKTRIAKTEDVLGPKIGREIVGLEMALPYFTVNTPGARRTLSDIWGIGVLANIGRNPEQFAREGQELKVYEIDGKQWINYSKAYRNDRWYPLRDNFLSETAPAIGGLAVDPETAYLRNLDGLDARAYNKAIRKSKVLSRPRTVNYIYYLKEMSGLTTDKPDEIVSILDDGRGSCQDLGFNIEKRLASGFIADWTTGVKLDASKTDGTGKAWSTIGKETFVDPAIDWWNQSGENLNNSFNQDLQFDQDQALKLMGDVCTLRELYEQFFDKLDLASLFCDYIKCIRLPGFSLKLPSFYLPPIPEIPILGWYGAIWKFFMEKFTEILTRLVCTFVKTIIDKLAVPFCEEQLRDFINAASATSNPLAREALLEAMTKHGVANDNKEEAKEFFDEVSTFTTGQELCHLLEGKTLDDSTMMMIRRVAEKTGVSEDLSSDESIANFFGVLGSFLPCDLVDQIGQSENVLFSESCTDVAGYISDVRNRLQSGDSTLSEEEIDKIVNMAKEELDKKEQELNSFSGMGFADAAPELYGIGNPNAVVSEHPDFLKKSISQNIKSIFEASKMAYVNGLNSYVPRMSSEVPMIPNASSSSGMYQADQSLRFEASLTQMSMYAKSLENYQIFLNDQAVRAYGITNTSKEQLQELIAREQRLVSFCFRAKQNIHLYLEELQQSLYIPNSGFDNQAVTWDQRVPYESRRDTGRTGRRRTRNGIEEFPIFSPSGVGQYWWFWSQPAIQNNLWTNIIKPRIVEATGHTPAEVQLAAGDWMREYDTNNPGGYTSMVWSRKKLYPWSIWDSDIMHYETVLTDPELLRDPYWLVEGELIYPLPRDMPYNDYSDPRWSLPENIEKIEEVIQNYDFKLSLLNDTKPSNPSATQWVDGQFILDLLWDDLEDSPALFDDPAATSPRPGNAPPKGVAYWARRIDILNEISKAAQKRITHLNAAFSGPDIYWYHAILLYALFDYEKVEVEDPDLGVVDVNIVHKKYKVKKNLPSSREFVAVVPRPVNSALAAHIENRGEATLTGVYADGIYDGVFDKRIDEGYDYYSANYQDYYNSLSDPDADEDFVLSAMSIENFYNTDSNFENRSGGYFDGDTGHWARVDGGDFILENSYAGYGQYLSKPLIAASMRGNLPSRQEKNQGRISWSANATALTKEVIELFAREMGIYPKSENGEEKTITTHVEYMRVVDVMNTKPNHPGLLRLIGSRIQELSNGLQDILRDMSPMMEERHLILLTRLMEKYSYINFNAEQIELEDGIEIEKTTTEMGIETGVTYSPSIELCEYEDNYNRDRYDIRVSSDFHLGLPNQSFEKIFKFCDALPLEMVQENSQPIGERYFSKREAFSQMLLKSIRENFPNAHSTQESQNNFKRLIHKPGSGVGLPNEFFKITRSILLNIFGELKQSPMFDPEYAQEVHARVRGDQIIDPSKKCVSNRYRLVESSILSYDKTILLESYNEIANEMRKPENSPFNMDFDDPGPVKYAMRAISLKAFVRICLIDTMLKGGLAYSVWDIEPLVTDTLYQEYVVEHILYELNKSKIFTDSWKEIITRMMNITNENIAIRALISEEIIKLPNFCKQVFNFSESIDLYYWYFEKYVQTHQVSYRGLMDIQHNNELYPETPRLKRAGLPAPFIDDIRRNRFRIEEYVTVSGEIVSEEFLQNLEEYSRDLAAAEIEQFLLFADFFETPRGNEQTLERDLFSEFLRRVKQFLEPDQYISLINNSTIKHGMRLVVAFPDSSVSSIYPIASDVLAKKSRRNRTFAVSVLDESSGTGNKLIPVVPILSESRELSIESCPIVFYGDPENNIRPGISPESESFMRQMLMNRQEFKWVFEHMFPINRFMSMQTIFATSLLSGYSSIPAILTPAKIAIGVVTNIAMTPTSRQSEILPIDPSDFAKFMQDNWPTHEDSKDCFEFPGLGSEFFDKFFDELWDLIKQMPSVLLRGLANQIEPGYKEMRSHYFNCEINRLKLNDVSFRSRKDKLTAGLLQRPNGKGKYIPIFPAAYFDFMESLARGEWSNLGKTVAKIVSYAYSGMTPFFDSTFAFKVPCNDKLNASNPDWLPAGKYDVGSYGRYGHMLGPFALAALSVPELRSDKNTKKALCRKQEGEEEYDECAEE